VALALLSLGMPAGTTLQAMESPHSVQRSWDMSRGAPVPGSPKRLVIKTLSSKDPIEMAELPDGMTVGELKALIAQRMSVPPRKALLLRWYGSIIEDEHTLMHYHIPDGAALEMQMTGRTSAEVDELKAQLKQLRIKNTDGKVGIIEGLKPSTRVFDIKKTIAERKLFKPEEGFLAVDPKNPVCELVYSAVFTGSFGVTLDDEKTLGSYGMLDDDVLLFKPPVDQEFLDKQAAAEKAAKEKAKGK